MNRRVRYGVAVFLVSLIAVWLFCLPDDLFEGTPYATVVTDRDGELLGARIADDGQWRFPMRDTLPEKFAIAVVEFEDRSFYHHGGVNPAALVRALWQDLQAGHVVSGGSTITMQLARMSRRRPRTLGQKLIEMFLATRIEARYSKREILQMYAAHAPFGGNVVGIDAAMWRYLGNDGRDLSWAEAATLAVLQNAPSSIHPGRNRDRLLSKRNRLLRRLTDKGYLSEEDYALAIEEPLLGDPQPLPQHASHWVDGYHATCRGRRVVTGIDGALQQLVEARTDRWCQAGHDRGIHDLAAVIVDVHTGEVVAYVGNADRQRNRPGVWVDIARSPRSSGSILKPLLYGAALQEGVILPHTLLPDIPSDFGGFTPRNFDRQYVGAVAADVALAHSLNVPNVHLLQQYGVDRFMDRLQHAGITTLTRSPKSYGLSLILGGGEVTLLEITTLYARLAAVCQGERIDHFSFHDPWAIYYMFEAMRSVDRPDELNTELFSSIPSIAWKTGTSYGGRDAWAIGVTPDYVVGVWAGNAEGQGAPDLTGARVAGPVMFDLFELLPRGGWFEEPKGGVRATICRHSGMLAGMDCTDTLSIRLPEQARNTPACAYCRRVALSTDLRYRIADRSEPVQLVHRFILPPAMERYYRERHPEYQPLPPVKLSASGISGNEENSMQFIYPRSGSVLSLPRQADGSVRGVNFSLAHSTPSHVVFWHLDDEYLGSTSDIHKLLVAPSSGAHRLTVVDETGATLQIDFQVR